MSHTVLQSYRCEAGGSGVQDDLGLHSAVVLKPAGHDLSGGYMTLSRVSHIRYPEYQIFAL